MCQLSRGGEAMNILVDLSNRILSTGILQILRECVPGAILADVHTPFPSGNPNMILFDSGRCRPELFSTHPKARFVLIDTGLTDREISCLLVCHKISGVIAPDTTVSNLKKALRAIHAGKIWIDQKNLKALLENAGTLSKKGGIRGLSDQDKVIVELISRGYKNREIAQHLCLCEQTIKAHISRIFRCLNVKNRAQLVRLALERSIADV